jgi:hypothetical protein
VEEVVQEDLEEGFSEGPDVSGFMSRLSRQVSGFDVHHGDLSWSRVSAKDLCYCGFSGCGAGSR